MGKPIFPVLGRINGGNSIIGSFFMKKRKIIAKKYNRRVIFDVCNFVYQSLLIFVYLIMPTKAKQKKTIIYIL